MCDWIPKELRTYLRERNVGLATLADDLWRRARPIHERQNRAGDANENGRLHVRMVEHNIWRFLYESHDFSGNRNVEKLKPHELFLLSAAACTHDFDKALTNLPPGFEHGEGSGKFLVTNYEKFGLKKPQAEAVASVVSLHNVKGPDFGARLRLLSTQHNSALGAFNLQRLVLLLKVADILHTDNSRISELVVSADSLTGLEKDKFLARYCIDGWRVDGRRIVIQANSKNMEQQQALTKCFTYMKRVEWLVIASDLERYEVPYELVLIDGQTEVSTALRLTEVVSERPPKPVDMESRQVIVGDNTADLADFTKPITHVVHDIDASVQDYLQNNADSILTAIIEVYPSEERSFWILVEKAGFNLACISGDNFEQKVYSFLHLCKYHETPDIVLRVFELLSQDCNSQPIRATYEALREIENRKR